MSKEVFIVEVEYDDHPEEVAEKFMNVLQEMGLDVEEGDEPQEGVCEYRIRMKDGEV